MEIDAEDMFRNWRLSNYTDSDNEITWLKNIIRGWSQENRRKFVQFVTGSSQIPVSGFRGYTRGFTIERSNAAAAYLPIAHNCFNTIDLPWRYSNQAMMQQK